MASRFCDLHVRAFLPQDYIYIFFLYFLLLFLCFYVLCSFLASSISVPSLSSSDSTLFLQGIAFMPGFQSPPLGSLFPQVYLQSFLWALDLHIHLSTWHHKRAANSANPKLQLFLPRPWLPFYFSEWPGNLDLTLCSALHPPYAHPAKRVQGVSSVAPPKLSAHCTLPHPHHPSLPDCLHLLPGLLH